MFVAIFPFYLIYFHYPLKFRHRFAQYSEDTNCKVRLSDKISRFDSYTKIVNYSSLREIITKWIDMRYISFMQKHLGSTQSQRDYKINF